MVGIILISIITIVAVFIIWDIVWRMVACWTAAKNNQMGWFIACAIVSSFSLLPICYLLFFEKEEKNGNK